MKTCITMLTLLVSLTGATAYAQDCNNNGIPDGFDIGVSAPIVYWTDVTNPTFSLKRVAIDGSPIQTIVTGLSHPRGMAIHTQGGKMYWAEPGIPAIRRANLDGTSVQTVAAARNGTAGVAVDNVNLKVYWTDCQDGDFANSKIRRANLDGSSPQDLVTTGLSHPVSIDLDLAAGKMYWTDINTNKIQRANLDGTAVEDLLAVQSLALALDVSAGKMYFASSENKIQKANLNGSNLEDVIVGIAPAQLAIDHAHSKLYWPGSNAIQRSNLNGSGVETITIGAGAPFGIAVYSPPQVSQDCNNNGVPDECEVGSGGALSFNGAGQFVNIPGNATYSFGTGDFTVEMWANPAALAGDHRVLFCNGNVSNWQGALDNGGQSARINFYGGNGDVSIYSPDLSWNLGQWYHLAWARTAGTMRIFRNGQEVVSGLMTANCGNLTNLNIGYRTSNNNHPWNGQIDDVRVWNTGRTASQISANMNHSLVGNEPGLIGYWRFDEASGQVVTDSSPTANNGTLGADQNPAANDPMRVSSTAPFTTDCNENGVPDSCDIASGFSQDCNNDSLPDECNLVEAFRQIISVGIPIGSMDSPCRPQTSGVWSVSTTVGISLNVASGIGYLVNPVFLLPEPLVLVDHQYVSANIPIPERAVVTYEFAQPVMVSEVEIVQHQNGITRIEGYVGDSLASLSSIGSIYGPSGDITGGSVFTEGQTQVFDFNNQIAGKYFRMVIRKTSLVDGYGCYRAYPRDAQGMRFLGTASGILDCNNNGVPDSCDIASGTSFDCNQDQIPDECQPVLDADGDGIQDGCDNCPMVINPDQANNDLDAFGNACDNCPNTFDLSQTDSDGDGLGDLCDNCPGAVNPGQEDCDNDGYGDACGCSAERGDMNGDGLVNGLDTQLFVERLLRP